MCCTSVFYFCVISSCCIFYVVLSCYIFVLYFCVIFFCALFLCYVFCVVFLCYSFCVIFFVIRFCLELVVWVTNTLPLIGPLREIKLVSSVSGFLHWNKLCSFRTVITPFTSTIETIKSRLSQYTNYRCSYGTNENYSLIRTSERMCGIFVSFCLVFYFLCCIFCVIYFPFCIQSTSISVIASSVICYMFGRFLLKP